MQYEVSALPERLRKRIRVVGDCWIWTGGRASSGAYGKTYVDGRAAYVHRVVRHLLCGPFSQHLTLDHLIKGGPCTSTLCCNPDHNEPVASAVNVLRGDGPPAINARKSACLRGHPFDEQNTGRTKEGWRYCRACLHDRDRARRAPRSKIREQVLLERPRR